MSFGNSISIHPKTEEKEANQKLEVDISNKPRKEYSVEDFNKAINEYKKLLHIKGKDSLASIFETIPTVLENNIELLIENKALDDEFNAQKADFLDFIRKELSNYDIQVNTNVNKDVKLKKAYTPQEKFVKMSEENPNLKLLVKKLDMDIGYA